jgi:membrane protein DedA with SNARE-associated domain
MHFLFSSILEFLISFIEHIGYSGIFIGMFLESTFIPIPSELVIIPAGMAASKGLMNVYIVLSIGILGNILGATFSYYLAASIGRGILFRIGKYFFIKPASIIKIEEFFKKHGAISVFVSRLLPGFRHFISLPAGIAKMNIKKFFIYTTLGSSIWTSVLVAVGFYIGENQKLIEENLHKIITLMLVVCFVISCVYIFLKPTRK